jgi:NOL1/NOP2/sun family putative RNA methylase
MSACMAAHGDGVVPFERYRPIVDDWEAFQQALERPLPAAIWTNTLRASPERLASLMDSEGIQLEPLLWRPGAFRLRSHSSKPGIHWGFLAGLYHVQEEVSLLPVLLLDPQPGDRVLDLCAAPGNKAAQISVAMMNRGTVVANDRDYRRMRAIQHMTARLGILNLSTTLCDGANYPKAAGLFDRVLVDVPCSCEGTVRKQPELALDPTGGLSRKMSGGQKALLRKAIQLCRPGGRIVYASCTYAPEENESVIDAILREAGPDTVRLVPATVEGFRASEGLRGWNGEAYDESIRYAMRIWPHWNDTGGFFAAVLEKGKEKTGSCDHSPGSACNPSGSAELARPWLENLKERFGMAESVFEPYTFFQHSARDLRVVNRDHRPPLQPVPEATGLVLMKSQSKSPKLTTAAARVFGGKATCNTVDLDSEQLQAYLQRQDTNVRADLGASCTDMGYVLVRHQGFECGLGLYLPDEGGRGRRIRSLFPKAWSIRREAAQE